MKTEQNMLDVLETINKNESFGFTNSLDFDLVINQVFVKNLNIFGRSD